jgi:hypothetical protein
LGILAWLALGVAALAVALRSSPPAAMTAAFVAAMVGFLAVGSFDSLLDSPRIILLVGLIGAVGWRSANRVAMPKSGQASPQIRATMRSRNSRL